VPILKIARAHSGQILGHRLGKAAEEGLAVLVLEYLSFVRQVVTLVADDMPTGTAELAH
jgi:hypothetical protein